MQSTKTSTSSKAIPNDTQPPSSSSTPSNPVSPSVSNPTGTANTTGKRKKTRPPVSPRLKQTKENTASSPLSRPPASPRKRPGATSQDKALTESYADERPAQRTSKSDLLTESSADDSVKEVSILENEFDDSMGNPFESTEPRLKTRSSQVSPNTGSINKLKAPSIDQPLPSAVNMLVGMIWQVIESQNWDKLGNLLESMHEHKFRFDDPTLKDSKHIQQIIQSAPLDLLMGGEGESGVDKISRWLLALDLLYLGCNWDAKDHNGVRAINLLRQQASESLIDHVVSERPEFKHLLLKKE